MPTLSTANAHHAAHAGQIDDLAANARNRQASREPEITPALDSAPSFQAIEMQNLQESTASSSLNGQAAIEEMPSLPSFASPLAGGFAHRHPKLTKALAGTTAAAVFAATVLPMVTTFAVATPIRLVYGLVNLISPDLAKHMTKSATVRFLIGSVTESISAPVAGWTPAQNRLNSGVAFAADVISGGTALSMSNGGIKAYDWAREAYTKTRQALGLSQVVQETQAILARAERAIPLHEAIRRLFAVLGDETPMTGIDEKVWQAYESKFVPPFHSANFLSSLLTELYKGFPKNFEMTGNRKDDLIRRQDRKNFKEFVNERLLPVLINIQNSEKVASAAFRLAEVGLGSCTDKAVFGWMDVELGTQSTQCAEELKGLANAGDKVHQQVRNNILCRLVETEIKKFRLNEVKKHADDLLQDDQRDPRRGGWQSSNFVPYEGLDHVECYLALCDNVRNLKPKSSRLSPGWYSSIPYVKYSSGIGPEDLLRPSLKILSRIAKTEGEDNNKALVDHLMATDNWKKVLKYNLPDAEKLKQEPLADCRQAMSLLDDFDSVLNTKRPHEYQMAAEAMDALYKKFNNDVIKGEDGQIPLTRFVKNQVKQCEPFLEKAGLELAEIDQLNSQFHELEGLISTLSKDSALFSKTLKLAKDQALRKSQIHQQGMKPEKPHPPLTREHLDRQRQTLSQLKTDMEQLENSGKLAVQDIQDLIRGVFNENGAELLHVIMNGAEQIQAKKETHLKARDDFRASLEKIASHKHLAWQALDHSQRQFTLGYIEPVLMGFRGYMGPQQIGPKGTRRG